jgi:hypothetical protein
VTPSPTTSPLADETTAPTVGFGYARPSAAAASSSARSSVTAALYHRLPAPFTLAAVKPRFKEGELVWLRSGAEGVVDDVAGPNEAGTAWTVSVWVDDASRGGRSLSVVEEGELEPSGLAEGANGERLPVDALHEAAERRTVLQLRVVTPITDSAVAAQVAELIESSIRELVGPAGISVEAERHWSEPFHYELDLFVEPYGDAVAGLRALAEAGEDGWLSCTDDGWRCDLWWSRPDDDSVFLAPEVSGAEVSFVPWDSPVRRPESERPLVAVQVADGFDEPA